MPTITITLTDAQVTALESKGGTAADVAQAAVNTRASEYAVDQANARVAKLADALLTAEPDDVAAVDAVVAKFEAKVKEKGKK